MINLEEYSDTRNVIVRNRIRTFDLDWVAGYGRRKSDTENTDGIPISSEGMGSVSYSDIILNTATHYYKLGEAESGSTGSTLTDSVVGGIDGTYQRVTTGKNTTGPLYTESSNAKLIADNSWAQVTNLDYTNGQTTDFTINFWFKTVGGRSEDADGLIGYLNGVNGFAVFLYGRNIFFTRRRSVDEISTAGFSLKLNTWTMITVTVKNGAASLYIDGSLLKTVNWSDTSYSIRMPDPATTDFQIGRAQGFAALPSHGLANISIHSQLLTATEIKEIYYAAITGRGAMLTVTSPDGANPNEPVEPAFTYLPELINEVDISHYVESWNITRSVESPISSLSLSLVEERYNDEIKESIKAMKYVIVEQMYENVTKGLKTDWISMGHFFLEGPAAESIDGSARDNYVVSGRGILKLATFNPVNYPISPDIIKVERTEATLVSTTTDLVSYRVLRPGETDKYYYNFVDKPAVRLWASGFSTSDDYHNPGDVFPVRYADGSIQVLGGLGQINFARQFFDEKLSNGGLGSPDTIEVEFYRFATYEDVVTLDIFDVDNLPETLYASGVPIQSYFYLNNAAGLLSTNYNYNGMTLLVKDNANADGLSKGCFFKIAKVEYGSISTVDYAKVYVTSVEGGIPDFADYNFDETLQVQITDNNLVEDALLKILGPRGYQMIDSTKPLFMTLNQPSEVIQARPSFITTDEAISEIDLIKEVMLDAPPNYYLSETPEGKLETISVVQKNLENADHDISHLIGYSEDASDLGVITKVRGIGESSINYNVALNADYGGSSICGAYKLTDYYGLGTLSQSAANDAIKQIFDLNSTTPIIAGDTPFNYGLLFEKRDTDKKAVNYFTFAGEDLFWLDIGRNPYSGNPWLIEDLEITSFALFRDQNAAQQSLILMYMTEEDYITETGHIPPVYGADAYSTIQTNMLALKDSSSWKPLTDEVGTVEGKTTVNVSKFNLLKDRYFRFIKVVVAQPWTRIQRSSSEDNVARVTMTNLKLWLSRKIVQTVELGIDAGFDTDAIKAYANRMRPRQISLPVNITLETPSQVRGFISRELVEISSDFAPRNIQVKFTGATLHETVKFYTPKYNKYLSGVVRSESRDHDGMVNLRISDYLDLDIYGTI